MRSSRRAPGGTEQGASRPRIAPARARRVLSVALACALLAALGGAGDREAAAARRPEKLLPAFRGKLLRGGSGGTDVLQGRRGLVYIFATTDRDADAAAGIVARLAKEAAEANVALLGVNRDIEPAMAGAFATARGLDFPIVLDSDLSISRRLGIPPGEPALLAIGSGGNIIGGFAGMVGDIPNRDEYYEAEIRRALRLEHEAAAVPALGVRPDAPPFELSSLAGERVRLADLRGNVVILVFFLPTCPHCHELLGFLGRLQKKLDGEPVTIVPVSVSNRPYVIEDMRDELRIEMAMYTDPDLEAQNAYTHRLGVPDTVVIDREGRIIARHNGSAPRIEAMITMEVRDALGIPNAILLARDAYSGAEMCEACHAAPHATWSLTNHAYAFDTLVEHGADRDPECLPCHTVGWERPGGYSLDSPEPFLEGVQCENCHGRGGPHQSPDFTADQGGLEAVCLECHTPQHSLHFDFAARLPLVSHAANQRFAGLGIEDRRALLERRDKRERTLFDAGRYVGSQACAGCHASEHEAWTSSAHASALSTLEKRGESANRDCLRCHTTGFGQPGGFPAPPHADAGVGCESCHGPGEAHVPEGARRKGTILALADKCDSCVILQICGSCHDDANDPGFEFELIDKLERIRHGMREGAADGH